MDKNRDNIRHVINAQEVVGKERNYKLSYELKKDILNNPQYMLCEDMVSYVIEKYSKDEKIDKYKLINDLIVFKSYASDLEIDISGNSFISILALVLAGFALIASVIPKITIPILNYLFMVVLGIFVAALIHIVITSDKKSDTNRLKTIKHIIFILEEIKENENLRINNINNQEEKKSNEETKSTEETDV